MQFCWVRQMVYYQGDVVLFQCFGDGFLVKLNQFFGVCWVGVFCYQFVEVQQRIGLQYIVQDGLFVYQVRFYFCYERRFQYVCMVIIGGCCSGFSNCYIFVFWVVFWVYCDQCWYVEIMFVFFVYFGVWIFWCYYYYGDVFMDLFVYFYDIEVVGVVQCCVVFYQWLYGVYYVGVLFVWCQVNYQVSLWDQFFVGVYFEVVFGCFMSGSMFFSNGFFMQGVGNIQIGVMYVQVLVQILSVIVDDDYFFILKVVCVVGEFVVVYKVVFIQLCQLLVQIQCIKVVSYDGVFCDVVLLCLLFGLQIVICVNEFIL